MSAWWYQSETVALDGGHLLGGDDRLSACVEADGCWTVVERVAAGHSPDISQAKADAEAALVETARAMDARSERLMTVREAVACGRIEWVTQGHTSTLLVSDRVSAVVCSGWEVLIEEETVAYNFSPMNPAVARVAAVDWLDSVGVGVLPW